MAGNGSKMMQNCKNMDIIWINHDKFNDNFSDKSSFDVKNAEAPFNCSFKMKIHSKRKKFEHDCTASGSGRNYKCDLVPGSEIYDCTWLYYNPIVGPHSCRQPTNQCFIPRWNLLRHASPSCWKGKTLIASYELIVKKTRAVSHNFQFRWLLNYSTIPTSTITQDNLGSGHSFHFWLNEDLQQEYSQVVLRHMVMHIMRKNNGCDVCPNRTRPVLLYRWLEGISWLKTVSHKAAAQARKQTKETSINAHLRDDKSTSQWNWMNGISLAFDSCPVLVISSSCHTVINPSAKDMGVTVYS